MNNKLKVLVVDDSRIFRSLIEKILQTEDSVEIVGSVRNGVKAIEFIKSNHVDLVTLDLEMPEMDGLETLERIQEINSKDASSNHIGSIMVSALTHKGAEITINALERGAFDFITKPEFKTMEENVTSLKRQLGFKIRDFTLNIMKKKRLGIVPRTKIVHNKVEKQPDKIIGIAKKKDRSSSVKAILIGVSTGGPKALLQVMPKITEKIDLPIFIVQHMPPTFTLSLANSLNTTCQHTVVEGKHLGVVQKNHAYIAPGGRHMQLKKNLNGEIITALTDTPPENGCRPAVDVLFRSAPAVFGGNLIAIILTGMGSDGTKGLEPLKQVGTHVIAQDEETSVVWGMPGSVVKAGLADRILPLDEIPDAVYSFL